MEEMSELWQHRKSRGIYIQIVISTLEEDASTLMVVYKNVATGVTWVRPSSEFYDGRFRQLTTKEAEEFYNGH